MVYNMDRKQALKLVEMPLTELLAAADRTRRENTGSDVSICGVINAKSGSCGEDCRFCAQSAHHNAEVPVYDLKTAGDIIKEARRAKENGACRFGIVTSGNRLTGEELRRIAEAIAVIRNETGIIPCASLGALTRGEFEILKEAGLSRYHHNIETSGNFYPSIVTTHDYSERLNTVRNAKAAGLEVCSGGILGMGESWRDRIDMAFTLDDLGVDAVPLNFLVPIKGTPLQAAERMMPFDAIRSIAIFRMILPAAEIKVVAGRESLLKDYQGLLYLAGANGMMVGGYLTIAGRSVDEDRALVRDVETLWNRE